MLTNTPNASVAGVIHADGSIAPGAYDLFVTPATGTPTLLVSSVVTWFVTDSVDHPVLFFISNGALYSIPVPQPAP